MDTRISLLIEGFENNGWILNKTDKTLNWWIAEIFELISVWNPTDAKTYLVLNVEPSITLNDKKEENIISVTLFTAIPKERLLDDQNTFYLSELNNDGISKIIKIGNRMRDEMNAAFYKG